MFRHYSACLTVPVSWICHVYFKDSVGAGEEAALRKAVALSRHSTSFVAQGDIPSDTWHARVGCPTQRNCLLELIGQLIHIVVSENTCPFKRKWGQSQGRDGSFNFLSGWKESKGGDGVLHTVVWTDALLQPPPPPPPARLTWLFHLAALNRRWNFSTRDQPTCFNVTVVRAFVGFCSSYILRSIPTRQSLIQEDSTAEITGEVTGHVGHVANLRTCSIWNFT